MRELTVARKSVGIDIGSHSVKAVVMTKRGGSVSIRAFVEVPIRGSGSAEGEAVVEALGEVCKRVKIGSGLVVTSISTQQATVRSLEIPFSEEEKARQILKFQTEPYLAFPIEEVIIDFYNTQTAPEGRMKVLLTAIHKGVIGEHLRVVCGAGIDPEVVDVDFMAVASAAVRADAGLREGAATVLDVGASKTIGCYIREGRLLAVRCITLGGDDFTEAIAKRLGVSFEEAERVKVGERGGDDSVLKRFGVELDRTLRYFSSQVRRGSFERVIVCGGSAYLGGLDRFLREALSAEVTVLSSRGEIGNRSGEEIPFARFATAVGLALRGVGESVCLQNFRQEEHAYRRPLRRLRKSIAVSGALVLGVASLLVFSLFASLDRNRGKQADLELLISTKRSTVFPERTARDVTDMRSILKEEANKLEPFRELRRSNSLLEVLADLSTRIGEDMKVEVSLFNYSRVRLPQASGRGRRRGRSEAGRWIGRIVLRGTVSSDSEVVRLEKILKGSPYLAEVENKGGTVRDPSGRTRFEFVLRLKEGGS